MLPRVYPILDTATVSRYGLDPLRVCEALLEGGAEWIQFRHKAPFTRETALLLGKLAAAMASAGKQLIINDRTDLAAVFRCGVHLGQSDLPPALARRVLPAPGLIGRSTHNALQLAQADREPVDYLALGPIFSTGSKANPDPVVGLENLAAWRPQASKPLAAIGGITLKNAAGVWRAGADSVAVISALIPPHPSPQAIRERMSEWLKLSNQNP